VSPEEMSAKVESILEGHGSTTASILGGTGYFVDDRLIVVLIGDRLCRPTGDSGLPDEGEQFMFAGRPVPGWASHDPSGLDDAVLAAHIEARLGLL
jgi:hypothetical protein